MVTILNNTKANFDAFEYVTIGDALTTRMIRVDPGICKISEEDYNVIKSTDNFVKACDAGAVVVNEGKPKADKVDLLDPQPKKRRKKKAE